MEKEELTIEEGAKRFDVGTASVSRWKLNPKPTFTRNRPDIPHLSKAIFDLKCSPLKFTKRVDYKNLQQLQLGSSRLNSRNG